MACVDEKSICYRMVWLFMVVAGSNFKRDYCMNNASIFDSVCQNKNEHCEIKNRVRNHIKMITFSACLKIFL